MFDWFGTLAAGATSADNRGEVDVLCAALGLDAASVYEKFHSTQKQRNTGQFPHLGDYLAWLLPEVAGPELAELAAEWQGRAVARASRVDPLVAGTLAELKAAGMVLGVISNAGPILTGVPEAVFPGMFDTVLVSSQVGVAKPDPQIYLRAVAELGCEPSEAWFIGDGADSELDGAEAAGLSPVLISKYRTDGMRVWRWDGHPHPGKRAVSMTVLKELLLG